MLNKIKEQLYLGWLTTPVIVKRIYNFDEMPKNDNELVLAANRIRLSEKLF